ncbi:ATP-binding protein [Roseivirga echinicomitans]
MLRALLLIILLVSGQSLIAAPDSTVNYWYQHRIYNNETQYIPAAQVMVFRDDTNNLKFAQVKNFDLGYYIGLGEIDVFEKDKTYWVKLVLSNYSEQHQNLVVFTGNNAYSTVYIEKNGVLDSIKTGYFAPIKERNIKNGYESKFKLVLKEGESASLLVKTRSMDNYPPRFEFKTIQFEKWSQQEGKTALLEGVFTGLLIILAILGISLYLYLKRIVFLFYAFYAISNNIYFLFFHGVLDPYIFPENPERLSLLWLLPNLSAIFYFYFARHFLNTKEHYPKWDKYFKAFIVIMSVALLGNAIYISITQDVYNGLIIHNLFIIAISASILIFILSLRRLNSGELKYFAIASIFLVAIALFASAQYIFNLNANIITYVQFAVGIEIIFFALGLGHKMKKLVENHAITQESLIIQLVENEKLQEKTNTELKEKVAERTHQINVQNIELKKARMEAEKATKSKSDFLSVMSHEIRTPLNAIISLSHLMDIDNENEETQEYIDALKFSAENLSSLINDVLDYNKIEAGKIKLESIDFSLIDLLKNIRDSFKFKAQSKDITLDFHLSENTPNRLIGDPTRLTQIFNNLMSNALKFTEEGSIEVSAVLLGIEDDKVNIEFTVTDSGIGIPEDKINEIFNDYEQASSETTRKYGGTGLGLSITQKLLELHKSKVSVSSKVGKGTSFKFVIEFKLPETFDLLASDKANTIYDLKNAKILVVDDNYMNRMVLNRLFQKWNAEFHEAPSGAKAFQKSNEITFDLILMDIHMDEMDGFECTSLIREKSAFNKETNIIGMTAFAKNDLKDNPMQYVLTEFISKPFDPKELLNRLVHFLNKETATEI